MNINKFKYTIALNRMMSDHRAKISAKNRGLDKEDRISAGEKIARMNATKRMNTYILVLVKSDSEYDNMLGKQLKLEREYIRKLEKDELWTLIAEKTGQNPGGIYNLAEIGDVLGLTRERIRQLEASAIKIMKHPNVLRQMKEMQYD